MLMGQTPLVNVPRGNNPIFSDITSRGYSMLCGKWQEAIDKPLTNFHRYSQPFGIAAGQFAISPYPLTNLPGPRGNNIQPGSFLRDYWINSSNI